MFLGSGLGLTVKGFERLPPHARPLFVTEEDLGDDATQRLSYLSHSHSCLPFAHRVRLFILPLQVTQKKAWRPGAPQVGSQCNTNTPGQGKESRLHATMYRPD